LYTNGALDLTAQINSATANYPLTSGSTVKITPSSNTNIPAGTTITFKVTTQGGTYSQITEQVP
jgi:hypothetical protein